jgi:hypothetical protein
MHICAGQQPAGHTIEAILPSKPSRDNEIQHAETGHDLLARISHGVFVVPKSVQSV